MSNLMELRQAAEYDQMNEQRNNPLFALANSFGKSFNDAIQQSLDQQRRRKNVEDQLSNYQQMMQEMSSMPDNSDAGKADNLINDDVRQRRSGIIRSSTMIPTREVSLGPDGINMKLGFKSASPSDQKNMIDLQKTQEDMQRSERKRSFISSYINGEIPEGAFLQEMGNLDLTPDEFQSATAARTRLQSIQQPQLRGQGQGTPIPMTAGQGLVQQNAIQQPDSQQQAGNITPGQIFDKYDVFGNPVYRPMKPNEQKEAADLQEAEQKKKNASDMVKQSAQDTLDTIGEIEKGIKYFGAMGNFPALPAEYSKQNWKANVDKLRSKLVLDLMNQMKQASRTGATGFGQLSEKELRVLQNSATALREGLSEDDAQRYINKIKESAQKVLNKDSAQSVPEIGSMFNGEKVLSIKRVK